MTRFFYATALAALFTAPAAMADQYMVQIDQPFEGASNGLLETLRITEIDRFAHDGAHFIVIEAPDAGYVEAYFFAISRTPITLHTIEADWTAPGLSSLPMEQRLPFLNTAQCGFCLS